MSVARFPVMALLTRARPEKGTVTIDRETKMFEVRPYKMHRTYSMPLDVVASMVTRACILDEVNQKRAAKKAAKKGRR